MYPYRLLTLAFAAIGLLGPLPAAAGSPGRDGVVSHWNFDGSLEDRAGAARDNLSPQGGKARLVASGDLAGTVAGAVAIGVRPGDAQYLTAPISSDVKLGPSYTIEAWIHPTKIGGWNRLVLHWGNAPNYAYHLAIHDGVLSLCHGQADGKYIFAEGGKVALNQLQHVVGVARRNDANPAQSTLEVYLNGRPTGRATFNGTIHPMKSEPLGIGDSATIPSSGSRYHGYLDELTIWNRALSPKEIKARSQDPKRAKAMRHFELARKKAKQERIKAENAKRAGTFAALKEHGVEEIVFAERAPGRDPSGHYYANFGYSCCDANVWIHGADGGRLCKLNVRTGELDVLLSDPGGAVRDPRIHYDGDKILFSCRRGGTHHYNLYEINLDGTGLRRITDGPWDDIEPAYLPDGGIVFCSTRCKRYIGCWLAQSAILYRCDADGKNLRMLSSGSFTENTPAVLPDGRVLYTRWEYVNRDPVVFHHLWTMNPDGAGQMVYFGNMHPGGVFIDAKPIPGTGDVVLIHSPGHGRNEHVGQVVVLSDKSGPDARSAMRNISRSRDLRDPDPISDNAFLVARKNQVLLMNGRGETQVLYTAPSMVHEPVAVVRRPREKIVSPRSDPAKETGALFLSDVYFGRNMAGVKRGSIKKLLVMEDLPKPANFHGGGSQPIGHGVTSTLKRILGTVPVEPDGSAYFEVPAMRSIYFAALDENDLSVKQMRSFVTVQPGETVGCVGCHEPRTQTPGGRPGASQAITRSASRIEPIDGVPAVIDFPRDVQPILDKHCVRCHNPKRRDGGASLVGDRGPVYSRSYYELLLFWQIKDTGGNPGHGSGRQPGNDKPYTTYSSASPLMKKIDGSHYDVKLSPQQRQIVRHWIDVSGQYPGTYAAFGTGQIGGCWENNRPIREMADGWPSTRPAAEAVGRRCGACHSSRQLPPHVTARIPLNPWGDMLAWTRPLTRYSRHRIYNLTRPDQSLILLAPLSRKAGGYAEGVPGTPKQVRENRAGPPKPAVHPVVFADTNDPDYQKILAHITAAKTKLDEIKRFDMPGFRPRPEYVREMQRYGVLPKNLPPDAAVNVYATDEAYWQSLWHRPK